MTTEVIMGLFIVGGVIVGFILRYFLKKISNKVNDAIQNKFADRKNEKYGNQEENLADRYKSSANRLSETKPVKTCPKCGKASAGIVCSSCGAVVK